MARTAGLLTLHGMGGEKRGYADDLLRDLADALDDAWARVAVESVHYQAAIQGRQEDIFAAMAPLVDWHALRRFFLYGFSDAVTLEHRADEPGSPYHAAQRRVRRSLDRLFDALEPAPGGALRPLVVVAHSLGCQVLSNYLWDAQKPGPASRGVFAVDDPGVPRGSPRDRFRRLESLRLLVTTGCNIPLFVAGRSRIVPFARPIPGFEWVILYDEDDVLGWPLRPLYDERADLVTDVRVNAGGGLLGTLTSAWNPFSHGNYWTDREVQRPLVDALREAVAP